MFSSKEFRSIARDKLRGKWGRSVLVSFLAALLGAASFGGSSGGSSAQTEQVAEGLQSGMSLMESFAASISQSTGLNITAPMLTGIFVGAGILGLVLSLVGAVVTLGHNKYYIDLVLHNRADSVGVLFERFDIFFKAVGLQLFMGFFVFLWSLLFIIPGIIAGFRYAMAPYIMAENPDIGIREAVNLSKQMMDGHKGRLFGLHFSFIGWALLSSLTFGIGSLWLTPYENAAYAAFYIERTGRGIPMAGAEQ